MNNKFNELANDRARSVIRTALCLALVVQFALPATANSFRLSPIIDLSDPDVFAGCGSNGAEKECYIAVNPTNPNGLQAASMSADGGFTFALERTRRRPDFSACEADNAIPNSGWSAVRDQTELLFNSGERLLYRKGIGSDREYALAWVFPHAASARQMRKFAAGRFFPQTFWVARRASFRRALQPDEFYAGQDLADALAVFLQRGDKRGSHVDATTVELLAAEGHVREMHQPRIIAHIEIPHGVPDVIAVEHNIAITLANDFARQGRLAGCGKAEEPKRLAFDFGIGRPFLFWTLRGHVANDNEEDLSPSTRKSVAGLRRAHLETATGSRRCAEHQPQRLRGSDKLRSSITPAHSDVLRLALRTQPRSVSPRFSVAVSRCAGLPRRANQPASARAEVVAKCTVSGSVAGADREIIMTG